MAHFAKLNENNIVLEINVVNNGVLDFNNEEESGIVFLTEWSNGYTNWKQTSFNSLGGIHYLPTTELDENGNRIPSGKPHLRFNYAGIGYLYDPVRDAFIPPQPFSSWILNEDTCIWESPIPYPVDNKLYFWDETSLSWIE